MVALEHEGTERLLVVPGAGAGRAGDGDILVEHLAVQHHLLEDGVLRFVALGVESGRAEGDIKFLPLPRLLAGVDPGRMPFEAGVVFEVVALVDAATVAIFQFFVAPTVEDLELPPILNEISLTKRGLVILVGATGSGKSTTLAAMVGYRNANTRGHIVTIEDPVEYVHPHNLCVVTQREVGVDTESWHAALKNTLRQAPDVILIGEIRDRETMEYGIQFAETGHLCLATLHANSANQALDRVINFFPEEKRDQLLMDMSLNIKGIISQRLLPRESGSGRIAAMEILLQTPLVSDLIFKGEVAELKEVMKKSNRLGMNTFDQALFELFERGLISYEDALKNADSKNEIRLRVKLESKRAATDPTAIDEGLDLVEEETGMVL